MRSTPTFSRRCALLIVLISPALLGSEWKCVAVSNPKVATASIDDLEPDAPRVGDIMNVTGSGNGPSPLQFVWDFGDGTQTSGMQAAHVYVEPGSYNVVLTIRDASGTTARDSSQVDVSPRRASSVINVAVPSNVVAGQPAMFMATAPDEDAGALSYAWTFSNGQTATGPHTVATFPVAGTYLASVRVTNDRGVSSSGEIAFDVADAAH
ncbi:MAG TPA: PKD domain-containing protein [Povalibacter sp.]